MAAELDATLTGHGPEAISSKAPKTSARLCGLMTIWVPLVRILQIFVPCTTVLHYVHCTCNIQGKGLYVFARLSRDLGQTWHIDHADSVLCQALHSDT